MSDETPWQHLQRVHGLGQPFEDALEGLTAHGLTGEDLGVLFGDPTAELTQWLFAGTGATTVSLSAVEPPPGAQLPPRRSGKRGFLGFLSGESALEGLNLFTDDEVFELEDVQFTVLREPTRPVAFGELVPMRVLALNCSPVARSLAVRLDAEPGLVQSTRSYHLWLEPGVICFAVLPVRVCPLSQNLVPVFPSFEVEPVEAKRRWRFQARPYIKPPDPMLLLGRALVGAAQGQSPLSIGLNAALAQDGTPPPLKLRPQLAQPLVAPWQAAVLWRLHALG
jgi:hypothetical protein